MAQPNDEEAQEAFEERWRAGGWDEQYRDSKSKCEDFWNAAIEWVKGAERQQIIATCPHCDSRHHWKFKSIWHVRDKFPNCLQCGKGLCGGDYTAERI
jgi:hypothetical protein